MFNWLRKRENFVPILIFILAVLPFLFNLRDFFLSDDWDFLTQVANAHQPLWRYFFTNYLGTHAGGSYRPLVIYFWFVARHFWQMNYFWYHSLQIFFHGGCAVLLYLVVLNFFQPEKMDDRFRLATVAAVVFALLPDHPEAVAWLASVADPLSSFFYLGSLLCLLLCLKFPRARHWLYAGSLLFFLTALFAKEMAMSLPFIVLIFVIFYAWKNRAQGRQTGKILLSVPYFILLAGFFWLRYRAIGLFFGYYGEDHLSLGFMKTAAVYSDVVTSFVLSDNWRTIFSLWLNKNLMIILIFFIFFLVWLAYLTWKKKWSAWLWLVFLSLGVSLVPVASFGINLTGTYFSEEGERYGYLPSLFFAVLAAALIIAAYKKISRHAALRIIFYLLCILMVAGLSGQLLIKNWRYEQAGIAAKQTLFGAVSQMEKGGYVGVLFFGLPDNFHGAPIFRNGWQEAISFYMNKPPIILTPFSRTAYETGQKLSVKSVDQRDFNYYNDFFGRTIIAKPKFSSADYSTVLQNFVFEPQGINDRYFGSKLSISLSPSLAANPQVALFFWNGSGWDVLSGQR
jgi:protein O-mannosyl-transferase